ncbi:MAG: hypothetical protein K0S81_235 [Rhodospirillales bacterium]|jgi:hypothetical protein|nr:hypothetical protein [Rhodospirillales bacterium]
MSLYVAWFFDVISRYGHKYGWGNIPDELYPIPPVKIEFMLA